MITMTRFSRLVGDQQRLVFIALFGVVILLVIVPMIVLLRASFTPAQEMPLESSAFTLENFLVLIRGESTLKLIFNTMIYALSSMALALAIAASIAWCTERTDIFGARFIRLFLFTWMAVPAIVMGFGWILLLNPGTGAINILYREVFGTTGAIASIYSFPMLVVITGMAGVPTSFVMISGLLRNMDPQLEQASRVHGIGAFTTLARITLPLLIPGLMSVAIYMFMAVVQTFDLPLIIGLSANVPVLSTRVYLLANPTNDLPHYGLSAAFGVLLLVFAFGLMYFYLRTTRMVEKFRVVTGKAFRPRTIRLGGWRWPLTMLIGLYFFVMSLPVWVLLWLSLHKSFEKPGIAGFQNLTFDTFERIISNPIVGRAIVNTVLMVVFAATAVMVLAFLIGWYTTRSNARLGRALEVLTFLPMAIPPIVMVLAVLIIYLRTPLYGTVWILVVAHTTIYLAFGTRTMSSALIQIHKELSDAALLSGASWTTSMRRIVVPLVGPQLINGWLWVFAHSARDLTVPLMLMTTSNLVISTALWGLWEYPDLNGAAALSILIVLALTLVVLPVQWFALRR